ncbi:unnamed protein product [Withania somnifera]
MDAEKVTKSNDKQSEISGPLPLKDETKSNPSSPPADESKCAEAQIAEQLPTDDGAIKTTDDDGAKTLEEDSSPLPPDLTKISQDIDQFTSDLTNLKRDDDESKPPPDVPVVVEQFAVLVEAKIDEYDGGDAPVKWSQLPHEEATSFLDIVDRISKLLTSSCQFSSEYKYAYSISRVDGVLQRAMSYIEEEYKSILYDYKMNPDSDVISFSDTPSAKRNKEAANSSSSDTNQDAAAEQASAPESEENKFPGYSEEIVATLNKFSKALIAGGYESECCQIYFIARRKALEESLHRLGFEKYSIDDVQKMNWDSLEREVTAWLGTFKHCTNVLFSSERKLADAVFADQPSIAETIFSNLSRGMMIQLLNFAEGVSMTKRTAEKLFKFLDIYETLRDFLPLVDKIFPVSYADELKAEDTLTRSRLGESMVSIFSELENSIHMDSNKTPFLRDTLERGVREHRMIERADSSHGLNFDSQNAQAAENNQNTAASSSLNKQLSPLEMQMIKVMDLLDTNLEGLNVNGKVNKPILKEKFKSFNTLFDEIHKTQSDWVISDEQLRSELVVSISNMVIPPASFLGRFNQTFIIGRQKKYVKYQLEEIETHIDELFDGNATPRGRKKL